jgi:hypothetical protein
MADTSVPAQPAEDQQHLRERVAQALAQVQGGAVEGEFRRAPQGEAGDRSYQQRADDQQGEALGTIPGANQTKIRAMAELTLAA